MATAWVTKPLTDEQRERLQRTLRNQVGRDVAIQEVIDVRARWVASGWNSAMR